MRIFSRCSRGSRRQVGGGDVGVAGRVVFGFAVLVRFYFGDEGGGGGVHRFYRRHVFFVAQAVVVQADVGGEHFGFAHAVHVRIEVVQAVDFFGEFVFARESQQVDAGGGFLVGVGVDDEDVFVRVGAAAFAGFLHHGEAFSLCGIHRWAGETVCAVFIGQEQVVFDVDDVRVRVLFLEGGDLGVGEGGFARSLVAAQEDELLHYFLVI